MRVQRSTHSDRHGVHRRSPRYRHPAGFGGFLDQILACAAVSTFLTGTSYTDALPGTDIRLLDGDCEWGSRLRCDLGLPARIAGTLWAVFGLVYCGLYVSYLWRAHRQLQGRLYQNYRISHLLLQLQVRAGLFCRNVSLSGTCSCLFLI